MDWAHDVKVMGPICMKKYQIIVSDPPWAFSRTWNNDPKNGGITYPTLTIPDIISLPVKDIAAENCALFLWIPHTKVSEIAPLFPSWGFRWVNTAFVWNKKNADGSSRMGLGTYTRTSSELCLLGIRGSMQRIDNTVRQDIDAPIGKHSEKPREVFDRIFRLFGNLPTLEMFARTRDLRMDTIGNEISGKDIRVELEEIRNGTWVQK